MRRRAIAAVQALDRSLLRRLPRLRRSPLDRSITALSRAADRSVLWLAVAGVVAGGGGRRGRRAAVRGLLALALASGLANGPLKWLSGRQRPQRRRGIAPARIRQPRTSSFPSGHTASGFAFATAAALEEPRLLLPLGALAGAVAYSRLATRVHYPSDVLAGAAVGVTAAVGARSVLAMVERKRAQELEPRPALGFRELVLVVSHDAGRARAKLGLARSALEEAGLRVIRELPVAEVGELDGLLAGFHQQAPLVVAAGGDGTVGTVADALAMSRAVMGVIPLGTSNDFARSLGIPMDVVEAVGLLRDGKVSTIDLGSLLVPGKRPRHFVHAATAGLNVNFAKLATRASLRKRLGRLTYAVAAAIAIRDRRPFPCRLIIDGHAEELDLVQLSVINAPVFGGLLGMRLRGSSVDDRLLDVLAVTELPLRLVVLAALNAVIRSRRSVGGIRSFHVGRLEVHTDRLLEVALDGEVLGQLPATFAVAGEALRVITPLGFEDIDD